MTHTRPTCSFQHATRLTAALALLLAACFSAQAQPQSPVTGEGFEALAAESTLYCPVPMAGTLGIDCPPEAIHATLNSAAKNPHIKHAVFMVDSEYGLPIENDHIGSFANDLEITAVVKMGLASAIFPAFFADHIYMTDSALIGGMALTALVSRGNREVTAKQVGIYSSTLASAAQSRKHEPAVAYAMTDRSKALFAWQASGKTMLSNDKPQDTDSAEGLWQVKSALPSTTLILDQETAVKIGFAKAIEDFDHALVGKKLGKDRWHPANQFGRVANEIGEVIGELEPLREAIREFDKQIPDIKADRNSRNTEVQGYRQFKRNLDQAVDELDLINTSLAKLYEIHPERHAYFPGPDGKTIVADPGLWAKDLAATRGALGRASGQLRRFTDGFRKLGGDAELLHEVNGKMDDINGHLRGIQRYGNAAYWAEHAKPDLPDDIYG